MLKYIKKIIRKINKSYKVKKIIKPEIQQEVFNFTRHYGNKKVEVKNQIICKVYEVVGNPKGVETYDLDRIEVFYKKRK